MLAHWWRAQERIYHASWKLRYHQCRAAAGARPLMDRLRSYSDRGLTIASITRFASATVSSLGFFPG